MPDKTYNGWTNYATWRVNLELIVGLDPREMGWHRMDKYELGPVLMEYVEELMRCDASPLVYSYAMAFLDDVNWREIAEMMLETYASEETETEDA